MHLLHFLPQWMSIWSHCLLLVIWKESTHWVQVLSEKVPYEFFYQFYTKDKSNYLIVFNFQNCSIDREELLKFEAKAKNLQKIWDHLNNLFKQWKVRTISGNRMFFNLFLEVSQIYRTIIIQIGKKFWDLESYRKS